jgi:Protein of unknown function (DUF3592)
VGPSDGQNGHPPSARAVLLIAGLAFAVGCGVGLDALRFAMRSVSTTGTIVDRGERTYTVQFALDGRPVRFESGMPSTKGFARSRITIGNQVPVRYDPLAPEDARVAGAKLWFFPFAMMSIGVTAGVGALRTLAQEKAATDRGPSDTLAS